MRIQRNYVIKYDVSYLPYIVGQLYIIIVRLQMDEGQDPETFFNFNLLPRDATQSAVMRLHVVRSSVCPSVTFRYREHI